MKNMIDLRTYDNDNTIYAVYTGPHATTIKDLFGTVIIPTPFTRAFGVDQAVIEIKKLNPDVVVYPKSRTEEWIS